MINNYFEDKISLTFVKDITNFGQTKDITYAMFNSIIYFDEQIVSVERLNYQGCNGLCLTKNNNSSYGGFDKESEDPRIFEFKNKLYILFTNITNNIRVMNISEFENFIPIQLKIENYEACPIEKNWVPLVHNNKLYFIYSHDPLIILEYDLNAEGVCNVAYKEPFVDLPFKTTFDNHLRGSTNYIHYKDNLYISFCHSHYLQDIFIYFAHAVILNIDDFKIEYVSKPIKFLNYGNQNFNIKNTNILLNKSHWIVQVPTSLFYQNDILYLAMNFCDSSTFLYQVDILSDLEWNDFEPLKPSEYTNKTNIDLYNYVKSIQ